MRKLAAFLSVLLMLAVPAVAQTVLKLEWPRTFTGQPDFAFTRDEALAEARARAARNGEPTPQLPTLLTLSADDSVPDPLRLQTNGPVTDGTLRLTEDETTVSMTVLLGAANALPVYASPTVPDLSEFRATLAGVISATLANWQPDPARYDLGNVVNTLTLQAIVTSPDRYAVINGGRYGEGSSFLMRVPLAVPDSEVIRAVGAEMPAVGTFDDASQAAYTAAYEETLADYAAARNANPLLGQQALNLPVVVKEIQTRKVVVEVAGRPYDLTMRYRY
ncbi:MAG: hypothetical protein INF43_05500 [Alphaproteobacteria bacterium]|nr:hypothetical protein [Alphaproteobacteria bacterium]